MGRRRSDFSSDVQQTESGDGFYSVDHSKVKSIVLVDGKELKKGASGITVSGSGWRGKIVGVDRETDTITVSPAIENLDALEGKHVYITSPRRRSVYQVASVLSPEESRRADCVRFRLNYDSKIGVGRVQETDGHTILSRTFNQITSNLRYLGARIVNEKGTAEYRLADYHSSWDRSWSRYLVIDRACHPALTPIKVAVEFTPGSWFSIYDYGVR